MSCNYTHPRNILVATLQRLYDYGMTTTSGGNLSIKDDDGNIWITPGGIDKGSLKPDDIVKVTPEGARCFMLILRLWWHSVLSADAPIRRWFPAAAKPAEKSRSPAMTFPEADLWARSSLRNSRRAPIPL